MIIFRFICWLRGFHIAHQAINYFEPPVRENPGNLWGTVYPCRMCGHFLPAGSYKYAATLVQYKFKQDSR